MDSPWIVALVIVALVLGAGALPLLTRPNERVLHAIIALASGFFLGVTFLHLLPEVAHQSHSIAMWACVLGGLLAVFFAELLLRQSDPHHHHHDREHDHGHAHGHGHAHAPAPIALHEHPAHHGGHRVVGIASFVGLSVHTLGGAIGIGVAFDDPAMREAMVQATLAHKPAEAFSLVSVLLLSRMTRRTVLLLLAAYALVSPIGMTIGRLCATAMPDALLSPAEGLAAGTFLYVAVGELLPEVFHGRKDRGLKILLLLAGIAAAALLFHDHACELHDH